MESFNQKAYEHEIKRHARWNFCVNIGDISFVNLAGSFVFASTILPLYASYLTSSAVLIGLISAIQSVTVYLPQLLVANHAERLSRKKPFVVRASLFERVPYLVLALFALLWQGAPRWFSYGLLAVSLAIAQGAVGVGSPPWRAMLGKIIDPDSKGRLFGWGIAIGGVMGMGGAFVSRQILATRAFPTSFGLCFLLSFLAHVVSWTFLTLNREPERPPERVSQPLTTYWKQLPTILRENGSFSRYLVSQTLVIFGGMGITFYVIYGRDAFQISDAFVATLTMAALISQSVGTPFMGWLADRLGHKWLAEIGTILGVGAAALMLMAPNFNWLYPAFVLMNLSRSAIRISRPSIAMEFGGRERLPTYTALTSTLLAGPTLLAPLAGGWIIDVFDYRTLFLLALPLYVVGWIVLRLGVQDPRVTRR